MRLPDSNARRSRELEIKLTPMIDVVFLLLVFFIWNASLQKVEYVLPSPLSQLTGNQDQSKNDPSPEVDFDDVVVRIRWTNNQPNWSINENPVASLEQLQQKLKIIQEIKRDAPVILHPDKDVPLGHLIEVYDRSRSAGFERIQFAVSQAI
ncbi:MAG TPA: biopolymer transporter ExbD [Planctomycetaceae bacterium]|nr:biopolymer transporter ExbD [Planctomycetaceae bacterium]